MVETAFLETGFDAAALEKIPDETDAIDRALQLAREGDLVCIMSGRVEQVIEQLNGFEENVEC